MQSSKVPTGAWKSIALDFIIKLPLSKEALTGVTYDFILVVTDRLTKYAHFIPYKEGSIAEELAYTFNRNVIANHGIPEEIISNRDKLFTSNFWKSLMDQLGIHQKMLIAYHPQTDGQTERLNQTLEQYLRFYVNYEQDNWVALLPTAQLAYNATASSTTGISPFFANHGFNVPTNVETGKIAEISEKAKVQAEHLRELQKQLQLDIEFLA
jgi:transposase InsO family protein